MPSVRSLLVDGGVAVGLVRPPAGGAADPVLSTGCGEGDTTAGGSAEPSWRDPGVISGGTATVTAAIAMARDIR